MIAARAAFVLNLLVNLPVGQTGFLRAFLENLIVFNKLNLLSSFFGRDHYVS
jgi:hypothetical protein